MKRDTNLVIVRLLLISLGICVMREYNESGDNEGRENVGGRGKD